MNNLVGINGLIPDARYSDGSYLAANPDWHSGDAPWKFSHLHKMIDAAGLKPSRIAEVGCGAGACLDLMQAQYQGSVAHGYELSPQALALARQRGRDGLIFYDRSAFEAGEHYDLAMAIDVIEHVEDPFAFARGMGSISNYQLFNIPLDMNVIALLREWPILEARAEVGHIHYFTRRTATALLEECDLTVIGWKFAPWALELSGGTWRRSLANLPRRIAYKFSPDVAARVLGGWSLMILTQSQHA